MSGERPTHLPSQERPLLVVLSGPSGAGKDAALSALRALNRPWHFTVTATTRLKRPGETDGSDYIFLSHAQFEAMAKAGEFLEYARVYGNWYGVPKQQVQEAMARGLDTIVKVDVQGAATIKTIAPDAAFVFLAPSSMAELRQRLSLRATESADDLEFRTETAWQEMDRMPEFDYVVVNQNGGLDSAVACIDAIITAEKCRIPPRQITIQSL